MTTRREVMIGGAAIIMAGSAGLARASLPAETPLNHGLVVFDSRLAGAVEFAAEAERRGARTIDINGNITGLYVDHFLGDQGSLPRSIAGMTSFGSLFALRMMVERSGFRSIYEAYHEPRPDGSVCHDQFGSKAVLQGCKPLTGQPSDWARTAAEIVMTWPAEALGRAPEQSTITHPGKRVFANSGVTSWILVTS